MHTEQEVADAPAGLNIVRKARLAKKLDLSIATLDRLRGSDMSFPLAVQLGPQAIGWIEVEIEAWMRARPAWRSTDQTASALN